MQQSVKNFILRIASVAFLLFIVAAMILYDKGYYDFTFISRPADTIFVGEPTNPLQTGYGYETGSDSESSSDSDSNAENLTSDNPEETGIDPETATPEEIVMPLY